MSEDTESQLPIIYIRSKKLTKEFLKHAEAFSCMRACLLPSQQATQISVSIFKIAG